MSEQLALFDPLPSDRFYPASGDSACLDCGTDTIAIGEYYMLHTEVWLKANPAGAGMLCIGCLEARLGQRLIPAYFTNAPCNYETRWSTGGSARLRERMRGAA